ncbi:MAG TPA: hypothetical protein VGG33_29395 [Polyangia bacterium]
MNLRSRAGRRNVGLGWVGRSWLATLALCACQELGDGADAGAGDAGADAEQPPGPGCGLASEPEPNDTVAQASPLTAGAAVVGCLASAADLDIYEVKAPAAGSGFFQGGLTEVGAGTLSVEVSSARDNAPFLRGTFTSTPGASLFFYWATAPGESYRIAVARFGSAAAPFRFALRATYTGIVDAFEPNDTRAEAKPITLGRPVDAFFFAGHQTEAVDPAAFSDWYSVTLAPGTLTIKLRNVPTSVRPEVELFDAGNNSVRGLTMYNNTPGGSIDVMGPVTAGPHRLVVRIFALAPETAGRGEKVPDNYRQPYQLIVSQP